MVEPGRDRDFAQESIASDVGRDLRIQDLDGDGAAVAHVMRKIDGGHAAASDLAVEAVAIRRRSERMFGQPALRRHIVTAVPANFQWTHRGG
ncbi:hypothetical protein BH24ACI5_BH24ACI5_03460 [soil metagenome]